MSRHIKMAIYGKQYTQCVSKKGSLWSTMHSSRSPRQQFMVNNALIYANGCMVVKPSGQIGTIAVQGAIF